MALTQEKYKEEKAKSAKESRKYKKKEKEVGAEIDKLIGASRADFQKGVVSMLKRFIKIEFERLRYDDISMLEIGKSFGTCDKDFKDISEIIKVIVDDIAHLKMVALINSLLTQEKLVLGRPLTMTERRGIFESVKIDYDEFAATAKGNAAPGEKQNLNIL